MLALTNRLILETTRAPEFIDITERVVKFASGTGINRTTQSAQSVGAWSIRVCCPLGRKTN